MIKLITSFLCLLFIYLSGGMENQANAQNVKIDTIAERMLVYQRASGGWPKHLRNKEGKDVKVNYNTPLEATKEASIQADSLLSDGTYDNNATIREINYLIQAYDKTNNRAYLQSAEKGIRFILAGQYHNSGGWPQFYPLRKGYSRHITYNDNAMINCMKILKNVAEGTNGFDAVDPSLISDSKTAIDKGIKCILNTQVKVDGKLTAWCAQHDSKTLKPAAARSYELPSLSGSESVGIVRFLMQEENPSPEIKMAIMGAMEWFENAKIEGYKLERITDPSKPGGKDRILVPEKGGLMWARFYEIETNEPFFAGRDGIKKKSIAEIEHERRNGYAWYGTWPQALIEKEYPQWKKNHNIKN